MGQSQLEGLQLKANALLTSNNSQQPLSPQQLLSSLLPPDNELGSSLSATDLQHHIHKYLNTLKAQAEEKPKRRRSYELIKEEKKLAEDVKEKKQENDSKDSKDEKGQLESRHKELEDRMERLEVVEGNIRANITELMATKKVYKIRQTFRRFMLNLLQLDNFYLYALHNRGTLQFHDFRQNYITEVIETDRIKMAEKIINLGYHQEDTQEVIQFFQLGAQYEGKKELFGWNTTQQSRGVSLCYVWKGREGGKVKDVSCRMAQQISKVAMISTMQEETVIMSYCKGLLQILQIFIGEWEAQTVKGLNCTVKTIEEVQQQLSQEGNDEPLLIRVRSYQQLQFQLLEKTRMYKKYVCQGDKAFLEFDEAAELSFLSNNFSHNLLSSIPQLWEQKQLFLEKIFPDHKPISEFLKRAAKNKVKHNKLYELDFQSKIRIHYSPEGAISRMHLIIEQLDSSSSSSSNYYTTSSTHILSEGSSSQPGTEKDGSQEVEEVRDRKPSALVRNLEKDNPGITNQGWINLFIKDEALQPRKNTYFKTKQGKSYDVKRSLSLCAQLLTESSSDKKSLQGINTDSTDLDLLRLDEDLLEPLVLKVFRRLELFQGEHVDKIAFESFLGEIHKGYQLHNNPFHNFTHGVNVMHTCFLLCSSPRVRILFSPLKTFAIVFSGLCHDVGHTGFTNLFEIASQSKKAITYNDSSPLQNFHAAYTFQILRKPQNAFLHLSAEEQKEFRQQVVKNILLTDIKEHFPLLQKFNKLIKDEIPRNDEYIQILSSMIVHTADFGGSAKQFDLCKAWSLRVNLEFSNQYRREGELGLPQTPFMKDLTNISILSKNQGGFLKVIVYPLYQAMDDFCGNDVRVHRLRQHIENNIQRWETIYQESLEKKDKKEDDKAEVKKDEASEDKKERNINEKKNEN